MALREEFVSTGNWLFRWRSYLPLLLIVLFIPALRNFHYPFQSQALDNVFDCFCLLVSLAGLGVRIHTIGYAAVGTSGRNTVGQKAESLNATGMYSVVRHPLYLGNFLMWFGISMVPRLWWFSLLVTLIYWLYYERIMFAEEEFLRGKFGDAYMQWAAVTPAFVPNIKGWKSPSQPFTLRTVLKKEHSGLFGLVGAFTFVDFLGDYFAQGKPVIDVMWTSIFTVTLILYLIIVVLNKKKLI